MNIFKARTGKATDCRAMVNCSKHVSPAALRLLWSLVPIPENRIAAEATVPPSCIVCGLPKRKIEARQFIGTVDDRRLNRNGRNPAAALHDFLVREGFSAYAFVRNFRL